VKMLAVITTVGVASFGAYSVLGPPPATRLDFAYSDDPMQNLFETIMPESGQICIVDDLNRRSGPVADPVKDYWDVEGAHWVIGLNARDEVLFHYSVLSRHGPDNTPVEAKSYCEPRKAGQTIQILVRPHADAHVWYLKIPDVG
jgi:hypothetical protein